MFLCAIPQDVMDRELASSTLARSFERQPGKGKRDEAQLPARDGDEEDEEDEELEPVDVNMNLLKNLLESFSMQAGGPGPASNLLGELSSVLR
jgi:hypothetical protein